MSAWDRIKAAMSVLRAGPPPFYGQGGEAFNNPLYRETDPWGYRPYWGTQRNYQREAGDLTQHSLVMAAANWLGTQLTEAPFRVYERDQAKQPQEIEGHPLFQLLKNPNEFYTGATIYKAFATSWIIDGNVYLYKERDRAGRVKGLWYLPHFAVSPLYPKDGFTLVSGYAYRVNDKDYVLAKEDVVHFRYNLDPRNPRKGLSPVGSLYRELYCDNERANFASALLGNFGIPGVLLSPASENKAIGKEGREELKKTFQEQFTGDKRGAPLVSSMGVKVQTLGFEPQKMDFSSLARVPEERLSAVLGIPAAVLGFGAGLQYTNYATMRELREQAYEGVVMPTQKLMAGDINAQLLVDFEPEGSARYGEFDLDDVRVLQEDTAKRTDRIVKLWVAGVITRAEARAIEGYPVDKDRDAVFAASAGTALIPEELANGESLAPTMSIFDQQQALVSGETTPSSTGGTTWPPKQGGPAPKPEPQPAKKPAAKAEGLRVVGTGD